MVLTSPFVPRYLKVHPEYVWYAILSLLGLATILNAFFLAWTTFRRYRVRHEQPKSTSRPTGRLALRRVPQAILSASRILSYRLRIPYVDMTLLELTLVTLYMAGCLAWVFSPSMCSSCELYRSPCSPLIQRITSNLVTT